MVRLTALLSAMGLLLSSPSLALAAPAPVADPQLLPLPDIDLVDWWQRLVFACPLWKGILPVGAEYGKVCFNSNTRTHTKGFVTARFYQVPGSYSSDARYSEIVRGLDAAVVRALDVFGTFATSSASPLVINVGLTQGLVGGAGSRVQTDVDNAGQKSPCYVLVSYPPSYADVPLVALQKELVRGMYTCVEQLHHPSLTAPNGGNRWWRESIARYFDGVAYPMPTNAAARNAVLGEGLFPEEYSYGLPLFGNDEAAALFWHYLDGLAAWTPQQVHTWMRGHAHASTPEAERRLLAADAQVASRWHGFVLAYVEGTVAYATGGARVFQARPPFPKRVYDAVEVSGGGGVGGTYSKTFGVDSFKAARMIFPVKAGQRMRVTADIPAGLEWSIRKEGAGVAAWNSGARTRSADIAAGSATTNFEVVVSSTLDDSGQYLGKILMTRTG